MKITVNERLLGEASFRSVKIGNQVWMASDLKINDGGEGIDKLAGYTFYTWDAAKRVADTMPGWRLPTKQEFEELIKYCESQGLEASSALRSVSTWQPQVGEVDKPGANAVGFGARRAGSLGTTYRGGAVRYNYNTYYWTGTANPSAGRAAHYVMSIGPDDASVDKAEGDYNSIPVRLIKE